MRRQGDRFRLKVRNNPDMQFFESDPLVLLDGVPVYDLNRLMAYDPLKVKKIEVVARRYFLAGTTYPGIVHFATYKSDLDGFSLDPSSVIIDYEGLQLQRTFYAPVYDKEAAKKSRVPDFRNQLCWKPDIATDEKGHGHLSFFTSDLSGRYAIVVHGFTNGKAGSAARVIEIK